MEKIREKLEEMITEALEKNNLEEVAILLDLRVTMARIYSFEKSF